MLNGLKSAFRGLVRGSEKHVLKYYILSVGSRRRPAFHDVCLEVPLFVLPTAAGSRAFNRSAGGCKGSRGRAAAARVW